MYFWTLGEKQHKNEKEHGNIDTGFLNESILMEFIFESIPQLLIQGINNTLLDEWRLVINLASYALSGYIMGNSLWRYGYHIWTYGANVSAVPIRMNIGFMTVTIENKSDRAHRHRKGGDASIAERAGGRVYQEDEESQHDGDSELCNKAYNDALTEIRLMGREQDWHGLMQWTATYNIKKGDDLRVMNGAVTQAIMALAELVPKVESVQLLKERRAMRRRSIFGGPMVGGSPKQLTTDKAIAGKAEKDNKKGKKERGKRGRFGRGDRGSPGHQTPLARPSSRELTHETIQSLRRQILADAKQSERLRCAQGDSPGMMQRSFSAHAPLGVVRRGSAGDVQFSRVPFASSEPSSSGIEMGAVSNATATRTATDSIPDAPTATNDSTRKPKKLLGSKLKARAGGRDRSTDENRSGDSDAAATPIQVPQGQSQSPVHNPLFTPQPPEPPAVVDDVSPLPRAMTLGQVGNPLAGQGGTVSKEHLKGARKNRRLTALLGKAQMAAAIEADSDDDGDGGAAAGAGSGASVASSRRALEDSPLDSVHPTHSSLAERESDGDDVKSPLAARVLEVGGSHSQKPRDSGAEDDSKQPVASPGSQTESPPGRETRAERAARKERERAAKLARKADREQRRAMKMGVSNVSPMHQAMHQGPADSPVPPSGVEDVPPPAPPSGGKDIKQTIIEEEPTTKQMKEKKAKTKKEKSAKKKKISKISRVALLGGSGPDEPSESAAELNTSLPPPAQAQLPPPADIGFDSDGDANAGLGIDRLSSGVSALGDVGFDDGEDGDNTMVRRRSIQDRYSRLSKSGSGEDSDEEIDF